jgi:carbonic anhydrase
VRYFFCFMLSLFIMSKTLFFTAVATALFFMSCNSDKVDCATFHWGYSYNNGPDLWGQCEKDCNGKKQSPININTSKTESDGALTALAHDYRSSNIHLVHNGHAVELTYSAGSTLTFEGTTYELKQAHFHAGSEHTIDDEMTESEIHLVHKTSSGEIAVIGVFIEEGAENPFFNRFFDNLPLIENEQFVDELDTLNISEMLPSSPAYFTYSGSLTTPPCTEGVTWIVMREPIQASAEQIEKLHRILHVTNRPVQKLNRREVRSFQ